MLQPRAVRQGFWAEEACLCGRVQQSSCRQYSLADMMHSTAVPADNPTRPSCWNRRCTRMAQSNGLHGSFCCMRCFHGYNDSGGDVDILDFWGQRHGHKCERHWALDNAPRFFVLPVSERQPGVLAAIAGESAEARAWRQAGEARSRTPPRRRALRTPPRRPARLPPELAEVASDTAECQALQRSPTLSPTAKWSQHPPPMSPTLSPTAKWSQHPPWALQRSPTSTWSHPPPLPPLPPAESEQGDDDAVLKLLKKFKAMESDDLNDTGARSSSAARSAPAANPEAPATEEEFLDLLAKFRDMK